MARKHQKLIKIPFRRDITLIRNKSIYNDKKLWKLTLQNNFRGMASTLACVQQTPPPLRNSEGRGGKGCTQATNNLTHAHCKGVLLDSPWCILVPRATRPGQRKRRVVGTRMVSILQAR